MGKTTSDKRDIYYRRAKELGFRARSAFKLMDCDTAFDLFSGVETAVDLCAAPGSWSQVLSKKMEPYRLVDDAEFLSLKEEGFLFPNNDVETESGTFRRRNRVVAVDIQPMSPIPGVHQIQGDITRKETIESIISALGGHKAGIVVCDGAPDVTGLHAFDEMMQSLLLYPAFMTAMSVLKPGGHFVSKVFRATAINFTMIAFMQFFEDVWCFKPRSSRPDSTEHFLVCKNYKPIPGLEPILDNPRMAENYDEVLASFTPVQRKYIPLLSSNDLSGWTKEEQFALGFTQAYVIKNYAFNNVSESAKHMLERINKDYEYVKEHNHLPLEEENECPELNKLIDQICGPEVRILRREYLLKKLKNAPPMI